MKVIFFGTSPFAIPALEAIAQSKHEIITVITQPDRPKGRGMKLQPTPVKEAAGRLGITFLQPQIPQAAELKKHDADIAVLAAYGRKINQEILDVFPNGMLGIHPSLLPKYRGAAPINWAIINGDTETGCTIYRLNADWDAGAFLIQDKVAIDANETADVLTERLARLGAAQCVRALDAIQDQRADWQEQSPQKATAAPKLAREAGRIEWNQPAIQIYDRYRGLFPWPGSFTEWQQQTLKVIDAELADDPSKPGDSRKPGTVIRADASGILVQTAQGRLLLRKVQPPNRKAMTAEAFLAGYSLKPGTVLGQ